MKKYLTRENIGLVGAIGMCGFLLLGTFGKLLMAQEAIDTLKLGGLEGWTRIIGMGELASIILFIIPKTMRLGAMLLAAYFGGVIMFHMSHPDPEFQPITAGVVFFTLTLAISWIRGIELIKLGKKE